MNKLRVALIGAGGMGMCHYNAYKGIDDMELVAVCDVRINEMKDNFKNDADLHFYTDIDVLLNCEKLDVADIVTPSYMHSDMVIKCLNKGLHVLSEKPMALNYEDAKKMADAAKIADRKFMVAHVVRFMKPYAYLRKELHNADNGKLVRLDMKRISSIPRWRWENWMLDENKSGGVGTDLSIHDVDFVLSTLGEPDELSSFYRPLKDDSSVIISDFKYGDALVSCEGTWYNAKTPFKAEYFAVFDNCYLSYADGKLVKNDKEIDLDKADVDNNELGINISGDEAYHNEIAYFINCVKNDIEPNFVTQASSANAVAIMDVIKSKAKII